MAASEVAIANVALTKLGAATIINLAENNERARAMAQRYAQVRDAELHRRRWKFSIKRATLAAVSGPMPDDDYARQFELPVDYLRLIEGGDIVDIADLSDYRSGSRALYSIEGRRILTNLAAPLRIRYIARITDTTLFSASFDESLASRLAYENCERITQSDSKQQLCTDHYRTAIREAVRANAIEAPPTNTADDTWITARLG